MWRPGRLVMVFLAMAGASALVAYSADQGKSQAPVGTWSAALPSEAEAVFNQLNVYGPDGAVFTTGAGVYAGAGYDAVRKGTSSSHFILRVGSPDAPGGPHWIGYRSFEGATFSGTPWCHYPEFDDAGTLLPDTRVQPGQDCLTTFLNHRHPQAPYWQTEVTLRVPNVDFSTLAVGSTFTSRTGKLDVFVIAPACAQTTCEYSGVGHDPETYSTGTVTIERLGQNIWKTRAELPVLLAEVTYALGGGKRLAWQTVIPQVVTTTPVSAEIIWTRSVQ